MPRSPDRASHRHPCYVKAEVIVHAFTCLRYSVAGAAPVTVIRDKSKNGFDPALITTEKTPGIAAVIGRVQHIAELC